MNHAGERADGTLAWRLFGQCLRSRNGVFPAPGSYTGGPDSIRHRVDGNAAAATHGSMGNLELIRF